MDKLVFRIVVALFAFAIAVQLSVMPLQAKDSGSPELANPIVDASGLDRGLCVFLGIPAKDAPLDLARSSLFTIHALDKDAASVAAARKSADVEGLYGQRIYIEQSSMELLPYADNTIDLIVCAGAGRDILDQLSMEEIGRVLRPNGKALFNAPDSSKKILAKWLKQKEALKSGALDETRDSWSIWTKPLPAGLDDWPHWNHGPDNNPLSSDSVIKAPYLTQWLGEPLYIAMPAVTTVAGGRIFTAMGNIAHHTREEPWLYMLLARNGYNGTKLWQRKLPEGYMVHRSAFIATDEVFYMIDENRCLKLDPVTGEEIGEIRIPGVEGMWKWMAMKDGVLYVLAGEEPDVAETKKVNHPKTHWGWGNLSKGYYEEQVPWGFGQRIIAWDMENGKVRWMHEEEGKIDSRALVIGENRMFYYIPGEKIGCLNLRSGKSVWENTDAETIHLIDYRPQGGKNNPNKEERMTSTPGFRSHAYAMCTPESLVFAAQQHLYVVAVSAEDGKTLWHHKKTTNNPNLLYADGKILVGIGAPHGETLAIDPVSGEILKGLGFQKRSCTRLTGCPDALFVRAPEGFLRYDRKEDTSTVNAAFRAGCNDGTIPANGLLYVGPWLCDCNLQLMGSITLAPAGDLRFDAPLEDDRDRLMYGPGDPLKIEALAQTQDDWPTYRANNDRSACSPAAVPERAELKWQHAGENARVPGAPTAAGGLLFFCGDDGKVRAVDGETGEERWTYFTGAPVRVPPTIWNNRAYVGSADGHIYCLEAATGRLIWRFRASPVDRRIMVYGSLCSTWPVNTGVIVQDGVAYAAAGIIDYDGTHVFALDATTGEIIWQNNSSGSLNPTTRKGVSAQGHMTIADGKLWLAGGHLVSAGVYDLKTGACLNPAPSDMQSGNTHPGEEIFLFHGKYIGLGGKHLFSPSEKIMRDGGFAVKRVSDGASRVSSKYLVGGVILPAWNDKTFASVDGYDTPIFCADAAEIAKFLELKTDPEMQNEGTPSRAVTASGRTGALIKKVVEFETPKLRWQTTGMGLIDTMAIALASNAVVAVSAIAEEDGVYSEWAVTAIDPGDGSIIWQEKLPSEPIPGGLLVDGSGRVVVVLKDGGAICFGS
jgi:outer membrane protein assembly factor BamB